MSMGSCASRAKERPAASLGPSGGLSSRGFELHDASGLANLDALQRVEAAFALHAFLGVDLEHLAFVRDRLVGAFALARAACVALVGDDLHGHRFAPSFPCARRAGSPARAV